MEKTFIRVRSAQDVAIASILIVSGAILISLPTSASVNITGFLAICAGLGLAIFLKTGYKDAETGHLYHKKERYFQHAMNEEIVSAIAGKPESVDLSKEDQGNSIRLDIYFSKATNKAYIQLYEYIPYSYEPCSNMYEYEISRVDKLIV